MPPIPPIPGGGVFSSASTTQHSDVVNSEATPDASTRAVRTCKQDQRVHASDARKRTYDLQGIQDTLFNHVAVLSNTGVVAHVELVSILFQQGTDDDGSFLTGVLDDCSCGTGDGGLDDGYAELLVKVGYFEVVEDEGCFLRGG